MTGLTHNQYLKLFSDLAIAHKDINSFGAGDLWEYMANENNITPVTMWVVTDNNALIGKTDKPKYSFVIMDAVDKGENCEDEVVSDTLRIAKDIVALLRQPYYESFFTFEQNITFDNFTERFDSEMTGWQFDIIFNQPFLYDACTVNIDGLPVVNAGPIYINTNQTVWGNITGTLANQTDLQSALDLKVPTSRTITINAVTYDLSANRSWTISGGGETLAQTLALGNSTGVNDILVTPDYKLLIGNSNRRIWDNTALINPGLIIENVLNNDYIILHDAGGIHLDTATLHLPQSTALTVPYIDASNNFVSSAVTPTQLGYLGGATGTTGTAALVYGTSPTFTTDLTTPKIIGNGATQTGLTFVTSVTASGAIAMGVYQTPTLIAAANSDDLYGLYLTPTFTLGAFTSTNSFGLGMTCGTAQIKMGNLTGSTSIAAIYMNTATPSATNYTLYNSSTQLKLNMDSTTGSMNFQLGGSPALTLRGASIGAAAQFDFTPVNRSNQTTGTNNPNFKFTGATTQKTLGADGLQYFSWFRTNTLAYTGASTCTLAASMAVEYITGGTNATITTSAAFYVPTKVLANTTNGYGLLIEAPTSATTTNAAAKFTGGSVIMSGAALATTATTGYVYLTTCAGVPTGVPQAQTGTAAVQIDSTNNKMYIYSGGAWVALN